MTCFPTLKTSQVLTTALIPILTDGLSLLTAVLIHILGIALAHIPVAIHVPVVTLIPMAVLVHVHLHTAIYTRTLTAINPLVILGARPTEFLIQTLT